ncbi:mitochondrial outer membrane translocase complex, subunit Tom5 [Daldinia caldariorum]|uniref:mitochondrial outer membrane translocase complex, subunit Tom5 n=1 Tax=Daldinia caldariorum TaxID=326644 RepID=UPI0020081A25|nr:mitochondrial outer membrane translocase complex, subunit Tom5 [Daldinia caldariorum]KAI1472428.1 mitochondrial outer membrane translocase complex, subunit Tom5 [Daldinia caldariorum]
MFGGFAPPQFSKEELEHHEAEAASTVQFFFGTAILLYLSPFAVDIVSSVF